MPAEICHADICTGCAACYNACPSDCIRMDMEQEGFLHPVVDQECCDDCGACTEVCPALHPKIPDNSRTPEVYACWHKDEAIRYKSSSGGAFSAFASEVIDAGGVVFGAAYDEKMKVRHFGVMNTADLRRLRGSKYVQSDVGKVYTEIKDLLQQNKRVLFSGTPCQVAGLKAFLGNKDNGLFLCDMLCHGVPSPGFFRKYVAYLEKRFGGKIVSINMRHKKQGWHLASTVVYFGDGRELAMSNYFNAYLFAFNNRFSLRTACYTCPYTTIDREGDITMADFWGIGEYASFSHDTRNGLSLILLNSDRGRNMFHKSSLCLNAERRTVEEAKYKRSKLSHPSPSLGDRKAFFSDYQTMSFDELTRRHLVDKGFKGLVKSVVPRKLIFHLRKAATTVKEEGLRGLLK
jgi:NAD-dependent dihydropyrimidine dehydrogenase PreA subunit